MTFGSIILSCVVVVVVVTVFSVNYYFYRKRIVKPLPRLIGPDVRIDLIRYARKDFAVEFRLKGSIWVMTYPEEWEVEQDKVRRIVAKLMTAEIQKSLPAANPSKSQFGIGSAGEITIDGSDRISISLGSFYPANQEFIYIRRTDERGVSLISSSLLSVLPRDGENFKNMRIFPGYTDEVTSAEAAKGEKVFLLMRTENGWTMKGRNMFDEKVVPFIESLLSLEAEGLMEPSFKLPPKQEAYAALKISGRTVSRSFFSADEEYYVVPVDAKLMKIKKSSADFIFNFQ